MRIFWWVGLLVLGILAGGCRTTRESATLSMLDGQPVTVEQFRGKPLVLNFWATWCAPCRIEAPELERAYQSYKDRGIQFLAVALDDPDKVRAFVGEHELTFPVAVDEDRVLSKRYGITGIPTTYFLNPDGTTAGTHVGAMRYADFQAEIEKLR
jgi:cytochrome c biogenesis protein CcmG/thiol:disulfide interchange protein DsbE